MRKVRAASGAVAVQVVRKDRGQREMLAHVGSAHTDAELGILLERAQQIVAGDQQVLDIEVAARTNGSMPSPTGGPVSHRPRRSGRRERRRHRGVPRRPVRGCSTT